MQWFLLPFSLLYRMVVFLRNKLFDIEVLKSKSFDIPVISIGNISVGGTGKTPHTEYLINLLQKNHQLAVLSRGYKRKSKGFVEVKPDSQVGQVGDEPLQMRQKFRKIRVAVDEKRVHGIETLLQSKPFPQVVLLDDAYQHRYVLPGLSILLVDYNRPIYDDFMLPVGRLREPAYNINRANIIVVTKCPAQMKPIDFRIVQNRLKIMAYQSLFFTTFKYSALVPLFNAKQKVLPLTDLKGFKAIAISGIANPAMFYAELEQHGIKLKTFSFADHYQFTQADIDKFVEAYQGEPDPHKVLICTEKDAVRLKEFANQGVFSKLPVYSLPIEVEFLNGGEAPFCCLVQKYLSRFA